MSDELTSALESGLDGLGGGKEGDEYDFKDF